MNSESQKIVNTEVEKFLSNYSNDVFERAKALRSLLTSLLPGVNEQVDIPAKMIAYCYGQKYSDMVCVLIPSKKGLKLGFSRGTELPDPEGWLQGKGKISRYVEIDTETKIHSDILKNLVTSALTFYQQKKSK